MEIQDRFALNKELRKADNNKLIRKPQLMIDPLLYFTFWDANHIKKKLSESCLTKYTKKKFVNLEKIKSSLGLTLFISYYAKNTINFPSAYYKLGK